MTAIVAPLGVVQIQIQTFLFILGTCLYGSSIMKTKEHHIYTDCPENVRHSQTHTTYHTHTIHSTISQSYIQCSTQVSYMRIHKTNYLYPHAAVDSYQDVNIHETYIYIVTFNATLVRRLIPGY